MFVLKFSLDVLDVLLVMEFFCVIMSKMVFVRVNYVKWIYLFKFGGGVDYFEVVICI